MVVEGEEEKYFGDGDMYLLLLGWVFGGLGFFFLWSLVYFDFRFIFEGVRVDLGFCLGLGYSFLF